MAKTRAVQTDDLTAIIEIPLGEVTEAEYLSDHVDARLKTINQRRAFRRICRGLQQTGAKTADGRPVTRPGDVVRYLLEQVGQNP